VHPFMPPAFTLMPISLLITFCYLLWVGLKPFKNCRRCRGYRRIAPRTRRGHPRICGTCKGTELRPRLAPPAPHRAPTARRCPPLAWTTLQAAPDQVRRSVIRPGTTAPAVRGDTTAGHRQGDRRRRTLQVHHVVSESTAAPARRDDGQAQAHRAEHGQADTGNTRPPYLRANISKTVQSHRNLLQKPHPAAAAG
jgi:hypothetical protein